ncbi:MAG: hypothetical protein WC376_00830 [Candidatus Nanoarchaeia archaeon]|jgi:hypothetical protein
MEKSKKSDAEINEILNELRDLELYDNEEYKKKLRKLKKSDYDAYFKIMIMLNLNSDIPYKSSEPSQNNLNIQKKAMPTIQKPAPKTQNVAVPEIKPKAAISPKNQKPPVLIPLKKITSKPVISKPVKKSGQKKSNPAAFAILSMAVIGILLLSAIGFFWLSNPPTGDTSRNSLRLGYQIFNNLNDTYLNYTFLYNSSSLEFLGKQYYYLDNSKITAIMQSPQRDIISREQNNYLYYDVSGNYSKTSTDSLRMNNALIISLYDEVYNLVNNYYTNESGREEVWNLTNIACAPLFFEIDINHEEFSDLLQLRYEMCLDNNGIPIAIAKESIYQDSYEIIIAYLESMNPEIGELVFLNKSMAYWEELVIDDI